VRDLVCNELVYVNGCGRAYVAGSLLVLWIFGIKSPIILLVFVVLKCL
jgi:hypothetical protein